jgi:hypothetical protein
MGKTGHANYEEWSNSFISPTRLQNMLFQTNRLGKSILVSRLRNSSKKSGVPSRRKSTSGQLEIMMRTSETGH